MVAAADGYDPGMAQPARRPLTFREYVALDAASRVRLEWVDGHAVAMAGGSKAHARLIARVSALLAAVDGPTCAVYSSELRIRVPETGNAWYPDASVVCGAARVDPEDAETVTNPVVLVEVLSASTEAEDRGPKWEDFQRLSSLRHYVLVSQWAPRVEHYARVEAGWRYTVHGPGDHVDLAAVRLSVSVDALYRDVTLAERLPYRVAEPGPGEQYVPET